MRPLFPLFLAAVMTTLSASASASDEHFQIPPITAQKIGKKIWLNECGGTVEGLTSWNAGEKFASLGIGHFIWYPAGRRGPYQESFPELIRFLDAKGAQPPRWLRAPDCPWPDRASFLAAQHSEERLSVPQSRRAAHPPHEGTARVSGANRGPAG